MTSSIDDNRKREVVFLFPGNLSSVRGGTEAYYVYNYLSEHFDTTLVQATDGPQGTAECDGNKDEISIQRPTSGLLSVLPFFLYFDIMAAIKIWGKDFEENCTLWTYRGLILTPLLYSYRQDCHWIMDIRAPPVKQDTEFQRLRGNLNVVRKAYYYTMFLTYRVILDVPDVKIAVSPALKQFLIGRYGLEPSEVYVQTLGVNLERFQPSNRPAFDEENLSIVLLSSISIYRGVDTLIEMLSHLSNDDIYPELHILGSGSDNAIRYFKDISRDLNVSDQITWHGDIDHVRVPEMLDQFDIAVSPLPDTVSYNLSSPAKIFEYLSMNLVVLASDIRCHRELIDHEYNGLLVEPEDSAEWAEVVRRISSDPELQRTIQSNGRSSIQPYDWNTMIPELVEAVIPN